MELIVNREKVNTVKPSFVWHMFVEIILLTSVITNKNHHATYIWK